MADILLLSLAILLALVAIAGCVIPALPGPVLAYVALLLVEWSSIGDFSLTYLWVIAAITAVVFAADYFLPPLITKSFGGSKYAAWGSIAGMMVGLFVPPLGLIFGMLVGAFLAELFFAKRSGTDSIMATIGAFLGFIVGTGLKLLLCFYILYTILARIISSLIG